MFSIVYKTTQIMYSLQKNFIITVFFVFEEMNRNIQLLKTQNEKDIKDKENLKRQVSGKKPKECQTLNNRLQKAKVTI